MPSHRQAARRQLRLDDELLSLKIMQFRLSNWIVYAWVCCFETPALWLNNISSCTTDSTDLCCKHKGFWESIRRAWINQFANRIVTGHFPQQFLSTNSYQRFMSFIFNCVDVSQSSAVLRCNLRSSSSTRLCTNFCIKTRWRLHFELLQVLILTRFIVKQVAEAFAHC